MGSRRINHSYYFPCIFSNDFFIQKKKEFLQREAQLEKRNTELQEALYQYVLHVKKSETMMVIGNMLKPIQKEKE